METPTYKPIQSSRRWRIVFFLSLILLVQSGVAYLLSWIDLPRAPLYVPIRISTYHGWSWPHSRTGIVLTNTMDIATDRAGIQRALDALAGRGKNEPVIVHLSAAAVLGESGQLLFLPSDATVADSASWVPLAEVLAKLKACPSKQKLLVL